jgi:hypothetical protein
MDEMHDERSLGELFGDLSRSLSTLIRQELELARTEMTARASRLSRGAAMVGVGVALVYAAVFGVMAVLILGLVELGLAPWLAALVVTIIVAGIGGLLVASGQSELKKADLVPRRTIETVREDADWAKERFR